MRQASIAPLTLALAALLHGAPASAGSSASSFAVSITLGAVAGTTPVPPGSALVPVPQPQARPGVCYSRTLSEQTRARVEVTCSSDQFVSIEAIPGVPFLGVHGGAFRYSIPFVAETASWEADASGRTGAMGTVTMLRLYDLSGGKGLDDAWWDRAVEMRVSF